VSQLESNLGKGFNLALGQTFYGDPGYVFSVDYPRYQAVTTADVQARGAAIPRQGRVVLSVVPQGAKDQASGNGARRHAERRGHDGSCGEGRRRVAPDDRLESDVVRSDRHADRRTPPELRIPSWTKTTLANGANWWSRSATRCRSWRSRSTWLEAPISSNRPAGRA
jgi:hypothetical protein